MEELIHDWGQWVVMAGLILKILQVKSVNDKAVADKVNMQRDIEELRKDLTSEQNDAKERKIYFYNQLEEMKKDIHAIKEFMSAVKVHITKT